VSTRQSEQHGTKVLASLEYTKHLKGKDERGYIKVTELSNS
jgi:hypothetical protein